MSTIWKGIKELYNFVVFSFLNWIMLYPKIFPLMFSKIFPCLGGYKHLLKENKIFEDGQVSFD